MITMVLLLAVATAETNEVDAFFEEFAAHRDAIRVVRARVHHENVTPDGVFEAEGTLLYAAPRRIVFRYDDPTVTDLLIDQLRLYRFDKDLEQLLIDQLEDDPATEALYLGFDSDLRRLRKAFEVNLFIPEAREGAVQGILLRPKDPEDDDEVAPAAVFEEVYLYLREDDYLPTRVIVVNDAHSHVEMRFSDYEVNSPIEPAETQFFLPEGTVIVENQEFFHQAPEGGLMLPRDPIIPELPEAEEYEEDTEENSAP